MCELFIDAAFWWTTFRLGFTTTTKRPEFHIRRLSRWGSTRVCGTPTTGRREAGLWRPTGHKHLSLPPTGTSTPTPASGPPENPAATTPPPFGTPLGRIRGWMRRDGTGCGGCSRSTWSTTTAMTSSASLKASLLSARSPDFSNNKRDHIYYNCPKLHFFWYFNVQIKFVCCRFYIWICGKLDTIASSFDSLWN